MQKMRGFLGEIDKFTITVGNFTISLSITDGRSREKISKGIKDLNKTTNQFEIIDIYRTYCATTAK